MTVVTVGSISEQVRGVTYAKSDASDVSLSGYSPILRANNITEHGLVLEDLVFVPNNKISPEQRIAPNDVIVAASSGSISVVGKTAQAREGFDGGFGAFCKVLRPGPSVDPCYFGHYFRTPYYRHIVSGLAAGANINNLRNEHLDNLQIPLPPLAEQKQIAGILDAADALRSKRRESLAQLDTLLESTFLDMFGDPVTNPMGWKVELFEECCEAIFKGAFDLKAASYQDEGIPFIRIADIRNRTIDLSKAVFINEETHEKYGRSELTPGDIVFSKVGTIDRIAAIPQTIPRCNCSQNNVGARLKPDFLQVEFALALLTTSAVLGQIRAGSKKAVQDKLVLSELRRLPVILPPAEEQRCFAAIVASVEQQKTSQRAHLAELDTLFASLQSRAFSGDL